MQTSCCSCKGKKFPETRFCQGAVRVSGREIVAIRGERGSYNRSQRITLGAPIVAIRGERASYNFQERNQDGEVQRGGRAAVHGDFLRPLAPGILDRFRQSRFTPRRTNLQSQGLLFRLLPINLQIKSDLGRYSRCPAPLCLPRTRPN